MLRSRDIDQCLHAFVQKHHFLHLEHVLLTIKHEKLMQVWHHEPTLTAKNEALDPSMILQQSWLDHAIRRIYTHPQNKNLYPFRYPSQREARISHDLVVRRDIAERRRQRGQYLYRKINRIHHSLSKLPHKDRQWNPSQSLRHVFLHLLLNLLLCTELVPTDVLTRQLD